MQCTVARVRGVASGARPPRAPSDRHARAHACRLSQLATLPPFLSMADGPPPGGSSPTDLPPPPPRVATRARDAGDAAPHPGRLLAALSVQREPDGAGGVPQGVTDGRSADRELGSPRDAAFEFKDLDTGRAMTVRQV